VIKLASAGESSASRPDPTSADAMAKRGARFGRPAAPAPAAAAPAATGTAGRGGGRGAKADLRSKLGRGQQSAQQGRKAGGRGAPPAGDLRAKLTKQGKFR